MDEELFDAAIQKYIDRQQTAEYELYHDYYEGDHRLTFATTKFSQTFGGQFSEFAINLCPTVVDTLADRVRLLGFETIQDAREGETDIQREEGAVEQSLLAVWNFNKMERRQHEVHHEAFKCGESYAIVWPEPVTQMPVIWPQEAAQILVGHNLDSPDQLDWGLKVWTLPDERMRVTFYTREAIYKFITPGKVTGGVPRKGVGSYLRYQPDSKMDPTAEKEPWPVPNPYLRVPIFPFWNATGSDTEGRSELKDVIPVQDAVNKSIMDMIVGQEYFSLPQRWATGIEASLNADGKYVAPFDTATGKLWMSAHENVKFGQFEASDVGMLQDNADKLIEKISIISRIPLHYVKAISGDRWPSGESLKTAESPFIAKVSDRMTIFGDPWSQVFSFALEIMGMKEVQLRARWDDPNPRAETEQFERFQQLVSAGVPLPVAAQMVRMDPKYVELLTQAEAEKKAEAEAIRQQEMQAAQAQSEQRAAQAQRPPAAQERESA